jgi:hypothetical protein
LQKKVQNGIVQAWLPQILLGRLGNQPDMQINAIIRQEQTFVELSALFHTKPADNHKSYGLKESYEVSSDR